MSTCDLVSVLNEDLPVISNENPMKICESLETAGLKGLEAAASQISNKGVDIIRRSF